MKKLVIALTAIAAFTAPALAADMPMKAPLMAAPVAYVPSWTGCYLGGGFGYGLWDQENQDFTNRVPATLTNSAGGRGWLGTVQVGCDYQFGAAGQQFVIGAFGDYDFDSIKGSHETPYLAGFARGREGIIPLIGDATASEKMSSSWTVGGRIGWLVTPSLLTYFSGGYTQATFDQQNFVNNFTGLPVNFFLDKATYKGYFLGAGDEYALSFMPGLFWKTEYRLAEFNTQTLPFLNATTGLAGTDTVDSHKWVQTVRSELVYRFNWGKAPVARY
jgi:outer membrane immunogenic protein